MIELAPLPNAARLVLQGALTDAPIGLAKAMLRAEATGSWHALHLAPHEWLLIGSPDEREAMTASFAECAEPHSLVDVSARNIGVVIEGADAPLLLNSGCPLDLSDDEFPVGACTRTLFGKASVVLWRTGAARWRLEYWRSFAGYVTGYIEQALRGLGEDQR